MYLSGWDLAGIILALAVSLTLIVTTTIANAKLTRSRDAWRKGYYQLHELHQRLLIADEQAKQSGWDDCTDQHCQKCHCAECD